MLSREEVRVLLTAVKEPRFAGGVLADLPLVPKRSSSTIIFLATKRSFDHEVSLLMSVKAKASYISGLSPSLN